MRIILNKGQLEKLSSMSTDISKGSLLASIAVPFSSLENPILPSIFYTFVFILFLSIMLLIESKIENL
jgi:hypothetical protein